ncbi:ABC-2 type transport system permease protein [Allocatelliglobosispora scoriae]|uniref:Transport permease protein n=1 Tax=Allocatelliglobosispora scoriae TaxID=643052 RepID=A0A841BSX1_9ACTN|nr:ABC transporter permease [Allocatelliglobosispora scoriae]MBB5870023.1 ABC-2 type transport system permease protein [Allocatelliglobosispora scoriae]
MLTTIAHSTHLAGRSMRILIRQPVYLFFTLFQPMVWLLLFSQIFQRVTEVPGFGDTAYITFLTPGVIVMTAIMSANFAGNLFIEEMRTGIMDRNLTSPVSQVGLVNGALSYWAVVIAIQALIVFGVGFLMGARFDGGALSIVLAIVSAILLALVFASMSLAVALLTKSGEAMIGMSMFLILPLTFLSSVLMAPGLLPGWVGTVRKFNPVDWSVVASREALAANPDWGLVFSRIGLLAALVVVMAALAVKAFGPYRRSV